MLEHFLDLKKTFTEKNTRIYLCKSMYETRTLICDISIAFKLPLAKKSDVVHKSPIAVRLIFTSVFCAPYAPATSMHLSTDRHIELRVSGLS